MADAVECRIEPGRAFRFHRRDMMTDTSAKLADMGMTVEARDAEHAAEIRKVLQAAGFKLKA